MGDATAYLADGFLLPLLVLRTAGLGLLVFLISVGHCPVRGSLGGYEVFVDYGDPAPKGSVELVLGAVILLCDIFVVELREGDALVVIEL